MCSLFKCLIIYCDLIIAVYNLICFEFRWYPLKSKNGQENKDRGELQVKIAFTVKSGSLLDLSKKEKHRLSVGQLSHTASNIS